MKKNIRASFYRKNFVDDYGEILLVFYGKDLVVLDGEDLVVFYGQDLAVFHREDVKGFLFPIKEIFSYFIQKTTGFSIDNACRKPFALL